MPGAVPRYVWWPNVAEVVRLRTGSLTTSSARFLAVPRPYKSDSRYNWYSMRQQAHCVKSPPFNLLHTGVIAPEDAGPHIKVQATRGDSVTATLAAPISRRLALMMLEDKLHPGIPVNYVLTRLIIEGDVSPEVFCHAFGRLVARHDVFRSVITEVQGAPEMSVRDDITGQVEFVDLSTSPDPGASYDAWFQNFCRTVFHPGEVLYRAALVKMSSGHFTFHLNQHHAITDGQSCALLHSELSSLYVREEEGVLEDQSDQAQNAFQDYLIHQHDVENSDEAAASDAYWKQRFGVAPDPVRFYGRSTQHKSGLTRRVVRHVGSELSERVWALKGAVAPSHLFTTLLFAFLRRISVNEDLRIGVSLLNREPRFRETVGLLMNVTPNRVLVDKQDSLNSLLGKVREEVTAIRPHRGFALSSRRAGYEVILHNHMPSPSQFAGRIARYELTTPLNQLHHLDEEAGSGSDWSGRPSLEIQVHHSESTREFVLSFDFNQGVWPEELRERAADHFILLLTHFLDRPDLSIDALDLLTANERSRLFPPEETAEQRGERLPTVVEMFDQQVLRGPDRPAVRFEDQTLTYAEIDSRSRALAGRLRLLGVRPDVLVGVCLDRSPSMIVALLATLRACGAYVPIDPNYPDERISLILEDADPAVVISENGLRHKLGARNQSRVLCLDDVADPETGSTPLTEELAFGNLAYVIFTSGSTGRPKGVQVRHHGLSTFLRAMAKKPGMSAEDRLLAVTTISFDIAALEIFLPLAVGASLRIASHESSLNARSLFEFIARDGITVMQATPATYRMMIAEGWRETPKLRVLCGGEAMPLELAHQMLERCECVWNMYGPTETTIWSSTKQILPGEETITLGHAIEGTHFYVLNDCLQPVPIGVPGELCIAGDGVAAGYHQRDDLTQTRFIPNPFSARPSARMYRTGDLVRLLPNLEPEYLGRVDFQVKIRGFRIELGEIESVLSRLEGVRQCVVVARNDPSGVPALVAYVIPDSDTAIAASDVRRHLRERLPLYMVPAAVVNLAEMPLTPAGKIDRKALPAPDFNRETSDRPDFVAPNFRDNFENAVAAAWRRVLGTDWIGVHDNFFDLGGDSLLALSLVAEIQKVTGIEIDLGAFFRGPTIKQMVEAMQSDFAAQGWSVVPLQPQGRGTPLFFLTGIYVYGPLAKALGPEAPVYGVYVPEERGLIEETQHQQMGAAPIERLAMAYRDAIVHQQPEGPYQLAGISIGGVVAIETARLLRQEGRKVSVVILLDSILPSAIRRYRAKWLIWHLANLVKGGLGIYLPRIIDKVRRRFVVARRSVESSVDPATRRELAFINVIKDFENQIKPYDGNVVLVRASDHSKYGPGVELRRDYGWGRLLTGKLEICDVPGNHVGIIATENLSRLAGVLRSFLTSAT